MIHKNDYECDKCEEVISHNEVSFEVNYGFICQKCCEQF
jgi:hypothetical protein